MKVFESRDIRNAAFIGHKASGKTSIAESALWSDRATSRLRSAATGTSTLDSEPEEHRRVVLSARARTDTSLNNTGRENDQKEQLGQLNALLGKKMVPLNEAVTGDIIAEGDKAQETFTLSVEKGLVKAMGRGVLAGYPVVDILARRMEIVVHDDVRGDVSTRRGRVLGSEERGGTFHIRAVILLGEIQTYETDLRSTTHGGGSFTVTPSHMEQVPSYVQDKIVSESAFMAHDDD